MYPKGLFISKNESIEALDTTFMKAGVLGKIEGDGTTPGLINVRHENPILFDLSTSKTDSSKGLTVCRMDPIVPTGIKTLNFMLDPSKTSERNETVRGAKENWYKKFGNLNFTRAYEKLFELLWYSRLPCFDVRGVTSKERDEMSVIKRCYWRSKLVDCATIFTTRSSDRGMCCAFNVGNANEIYKSTMYKSYTEKMQNKTIAESYPGVPDGLVSVIICCYRYS